MAKDYKVIIPWFGVSKGEVISLETVHPSIEPNVILVSDESGGAKLEVATPEALDRKEVIAILKENKIPFDGKDSTEELAKLLPKK
jgi:hypothetical protein